MTDKQFSIVSNIVKSAEWVKKRAGSQFNARVQIVLKLDRCLYQICSQ